VKLKLIFGIVLLLVGISMTVIIFLGARLCGIAGTPDNCPDFTTNENFTTVLCFTDLGLIFIFLHFFSDIWFRSKSKGGEQLLTKSKTKTQSKKALKKEKERSQ